MKAKNLLTKKEKEIKKRLFVIGSMQSHDRYFYNLFQNDIDLTEEEREAMDGLYIIAGHGIFGEIVDDELTNTSIKWILTGKKKYYEILKDWFKKHLKSRAKEIKEKQTAEFLNEQIFQTNKETSGYIYLLKSRNLYKIGKAKQLRNRMKAYRTENPFGIKVILQKKVKDSGSIERQLHNLVSNKRIRGEWFRLAKRDIEIIKDFLNETT